MCRQFAHIVLGTMDAVRLAPAKAWQAHGALGQRPRRGEAPISVVDRRSTGPTSPSTRCCCAQASKVSSIRFIFRSASAQTSRSEPKNSARASRMQAGTAST
jgi:hypothetical protein